MDDHAPITVHLSLLKSNEIFDGLNFDCLVENCQKRQNFPRQNFALYGMSDCDAITFKGAMHCQ